MIETLKYSPNINFKSAKPAKQKQQSAPSEVRNEETADTPQKGHGIEKAKGVITKIRNGSVHILKKFNSITGTTQGVVRGIAEGAGAAVVIGALGRNIKKSKGQIGGTIKGIAKDTGKGLLNVAKFVPSLLTKAPLENAKNVVTLPVKFYTDYLKGNNATKCIAVAASLGVAGLRVAQGIMKANSKNADIDHNLNEGHLPY